MNVSGLVTMHASAILHGTLTVNGSVIIDGRTADAFPAGTRMLFVQPTAPVGWVQDTSDTATDRMLRVTPFLNQGNQVGGVHTPVTMNVVPAHTHGFTTGFVSVDHQHIASGWTAGGGDHAHEFAVWSSGISSNHFHGGSTDNGSSQTNWQPRFLNVILCTKA